MRWLGLVLVLVGAAAFLWVGRDGERMRTDRRGARAQPDAPPRTGTADRGVTSPPELPSLETPVETARAGGTEVRVRVLDRASGKPLPRARVEVEAAPILTEEQLRELAVRPPTVSMEELGYLRDVANADARGEATFRVVPPSRLDVWTDVDGYIRTYRELVVESNDPPALEILLERGLTLTVRAVVDGGSPAAGARLCLFPEDTARADEDGRCTWTGVRPGTHEVEGTHESEGKRYRGRAKFPSGTGENVLELTVVAENRRVEVEVVDADGRPVPVADVVISRVFYVDPATLELRDGRVTFETMDDTVAVDVVRPRRRDGTRLPFGAARRQGSSLEPFRFRLPRERTIAGRVQDGEGQPIPGVTVRAFPLDEEGREPPHHAEAEAEADGSFLLPNLDEGMYRLIPTEAGGFIAAPTDVVAGTRDAKVILQRDAQPAVEVLGPGGVPLERAVVQVYAKPADLARRKGALASAWTDVRGLAKLRRVPPRTDYYLVVLPPEGRTDLAPQLDRAWTAADCTRTLTSSQAVHGTVRDSAGKPVAGVDVSVHLWGDSEHGYYIGRTESGADGTFRIEGVPAGTVHLLASPRGSQRWTERAVETNGPGVDFVLDPGLSVVLRVVDWRGQDTGEATLRSEGHDGWSQTDWADSGVFSFEGVPRGGRFTLWISPGDDGLLALRRGLRITGDELRVTLEQGKPLSVRVEGPDERVDPTVFIVQHGIHFGFAERDAAGSYTFAAMPAGTWTVEASADHAGKSYRGQVRVAAGETGTLKLEREKPR